MSPKPAFAPFPKVASRGDGHTISFTDAREAPDRGLTAEDDSLIEIQSIDCHGVPMPLSKPIIFQPTRRGDVLVVEDAELSLEEEAGSIKELMAALSDHVSFLYRTYAIEKDENLTEDALVLAKKLRGHL
jgi:hypothetical protein